MAQKTNLNVSPYFDDFAEDNFGARDKNYYKVLFNPGKPIQARELNTLQSILQDQVETFGSHIFKEGSLVIPGNIVFDNQFYAVKLNPTQYGVNLTSYLSNFVGKTITGQVSAITAKIQFVQLPNSEVEYPTIYVKYLNSDSNFEINPFQDNEPLYANETVGSIISGVNFATTLTSDATSTGSAASIGQGVYFVRGTFVRVSQQTILLDYYNNTPSYRIGLQVNEDIISAKDDDSLYDNAKGFSNYAAPGADRFKISLTLTKKLLSDTNDTDFIELLRVQDGAIKKIEVKSNYSTIKDYLAQRTYDESGNYVVTPFQFSLNNSLNNRLGNDGLFFDTEKTENGNTPSNDLMCIKFSPGKAYVEGYDIEKTGVEIIDVSKPRTTQSISSVNIPFEMGNLLRLNNISGAPKIKEVIYLQNRRKNSSLVGNGTTIGVARVYNFNLTDAAYSSPATNWNLYLYDIQTYSELILNQSVSSIEVPVTSYIKGKSSGSSGYVVSAGSGSTSITIRQTSGSFIVGEQITINNAETYSRSIVSIKNYGVNDIKSVHQPTSVSGFSTAFLGDTQLYKVSRPETITISVSSGSPSISTVTVASPASFSGIKTDDIIRYQRSGVSTEIYNRVSSISPSLTSLTLEAITSVSGVCDGTLPSVGIGTTFSGSYSIGYPKILNESKAFLYAQIPNNNVSSVNLNSSNIIFTAQSNSSFTPTVSSSTLTVDVGNFNIGITSSSISFAGFDQERYSIFYTDGTTESLTSDKVSFSSNPSRVTFSNIQNKTISSINATFIKNSVQSKIKQFNRSKVINIFLSKNPESGTGINTSTNDGLRYNQYYGLRVQDEEISLNYPDVVKIIALYESLDTSAPVLDQISFSSVANVTNNAIIGENIIGNSSGSVARIVTKPSSNVLGIVYLNDSKFSSGENVTFKESNINTNITSITLGQYKDIKNKFTLDKGQKDQYYDYSKIVRKSGESAPARQLLVVFDYYSIPTNDTGDVFTANSYNEERFLEDIPNIGKNNVRSTDTLDFRPYVSVFNSTSSSPFDFGSRSFGTDPKLIVAPNEGALIGYQFYLGRIDKLYLDKLGYFNVVKGIPATNPKAPSIPNNVMEIATINLPPYLYNPKDASISLSDNRRYTMRDIGKIEERVVNLERVTSLSLLELNTQTLQIQDGQGFNRFKTGFFVDDFKDTSLINNTYSKVLIDNDQLGPQVSKNTLALRPIPSQNISDNNLDLTQNFSLSDPNVQKTGDAITLKYESIPWIEQSFATQVENVNPFHVISYSGTIKLNPEKDSWTRTIRLEDINVNQTNWVWLYATGRYSIVGRDTSTVSVDNVVASGTELYMRSRNTGFTAVNLKPLTRVYQFLDGNSSVDFIPKLVEIANDSSLQNYGSSTAFQVGESVKGFYNGVQLINFRLASSNHKDGNFNNPSITYTTNPYSSSENIPASYSSSSKTLNIDINSLCTEAQGIYSGYLVTGMKLIGQTSGAVAYVKDLKLVTDVNGFLSGAFFLRDPLSTPTPSVRIATGSKVYKLTSSSTNETPLPGSTLISSAESVYQSQGTWEERQTTNTTTTTIYYVDPLAQSFTVGGNTEASNGNKPNEDANGVFITAVDLFFAHKDPGNAPLTVEIRTVELSTPTRTIVGKPVTLHPNDINVSSDASVATRVTFESPIYLQPNLQYAIVLLAPQSDNYEVWIAEMGKKTITTANLPDSQAVRYSQQFAVGRLYKSQNGSEWTPNDYQDLKFKLYKAKFVSSTGSVLLSNPTLDKSNSYIPKLKSNPITILPRKVKLGITTTTDTSIIGILTTGRKISVQSGSYNYGTIVGTGSSVASVSIGAGGSNYSTSGNVQTYNIIGNGTGLRLNITASGGTISAVAISNLSYSNGYMVGDVVGIVTSSVSPAAGQGARITISSVVNAIDTLYLSNVQGESFTVGVATLSYYDNSGNLTSLGNTTILSSTPTGSFYSGNYFKLNHYDHGMYSKNNKVTISDVETDITPTTLSNKLLASDTTVSVASTSNLSTFEGLTISSSNPGFIKIEDEIIKYTSVGVGNLQGITRGIDSTKVIDHDVNIQVFKYELGGVSLRRINKTHTIADTGIDIDNYYVQFDRTNFDSNAPNRVADQGSSGTPVSSPQLSFNRELICGGVNVRASENIQFDSITPQLDYINPGSQTSVTGEIRTTSGTSVSGNEISFVDQQYESVKLGVANKLSSTRIICSNINEQTYLSSGKSFTLKANLSTKDPNISPIIFWKTSQIKLESNRLNSPIGDYVTDGRVNQLLTDPHASIYVSNTVRLSQPARSLKVIVSAYRHSSADFRVLYSLIRPDSSEVMQPFNLFPGYTNLTIDQNLDGFLDVIDLSKNNGLPDVFVPASLDNQFLEYEFSANDLGSFTGYTIKIVMSGTNQAYPVRFKDLRSIALA